MAADTPTGHCPQHPDKPAVGICLSCGRLVCAQCRHRRERAGIPRNICPECLATQDARTSRTTLLARIAVFVLVGLAVGYLINAKEDLPEAAERLATVSEAVLRFEGDTSRFPRELSELFSRPDDVKASWFGPYLAKDTGTATGSQTVPKQPVDVHGQPLGYLDDERGVLIASPGEDSEYQTNLSEIGCYDEPAGDDLLAWVLIRQEEVIKSEEVEEVSGN